MTQQSGWQVYRRLFGYTARYWPVFVAGILATAAYAYIESQLVAGFEVIINKALNEKDVPFLKQLPFIILAAVLLRGFASFLSIYCFEWIGRKNVEALRVELFAKYMTLPIAVFDQENSGDMVSKITFNAETVTQAATQAISLILRSGGIIVFALIAMMQISVTLTLTFLITAPVIALVVNLAANVSAKSVIMFKTRWGR